jgi:hypothetical protein
LCYLVHIHELYHILKIMESVKHAWSVNILAKPIWLLACEPCMKVTNTFKPICLPFYNVPISSINQQNIWKFKHIVGDMEFALEILELKLIRCGRTCVICGGYLRPNLEISFENNNFNHTRWCIRLMTLFES